MERMCTDSRFPICLATTTAQTQPPTQKNLPVVTVIVAFLCQLSFSVFITGVNNREVFKSEVMLIVYVFHSTCEKVFIPPNLAPRITPPLIPLIFF